MQTQATTDGTFTRFVLQSASARHLTHAVWPLSTTIKGDASAQEEAAPAGDPMELDDDEGNEDALMDHADEILGQGSGNEEEEHSDE